MTRLVDYPADIDPECIPLCDALNDLPGVRTVASCCGHGESPFQILFVSDTIECVGYVADAVAHGPFRAWSRGWRVEVHGYHFEDGAQSWQEGVTVFALIGPVGAYETARRGAEYIKAFNPGRE